MKKILLSVLCLACAAMTFTACSEADELTESTDINAARRLTIVADMPDVTDGTRTMVKEDGAGNYVPMWSNVPYTGEDGTAIMKQVPDFIYGYFEGQKRLYKFNAREEMPSLKASFEEELTGGSTFIEDFKASGAKVAYFAKNNAQNTDKHLTEIKISQTENMPTQLSPTMLNGDILISEAVKAEDLTSGTLKLRFKRLSGVIRLNIIAGEGVDLSNELFMMIRLSNPEHTDAYGNIASMKYTDSYVDPETGEIIPYNNTEDNLAPVMNCAFDENMYFFFNIVETNGNTFTNYIVSNPLELKEGQKLNLMIQTFDKQITKELTVGAEGFKIEAGKVTTMNVTINKKDMPAATEIKASTPGSLDENAIEEIVKNVDEKGISNIRVVGDIDAHDIGVLREVFSKEVVNGKTYNLDFSNSYFIYDDTSYSGPDGETVTIPKPNVMPRFMFYGMKRVRGLILPFGTSKIMTGAISMDNLESLDIPQHVSEIESGAICLNNESDNTINVYIDIKAGPETINLHDGFCTSTAYNINAVLGLERSWFTYSPDVPEPGCKNVVWKGFEWNNVREL